MSIATPPPPKKNKQIKAQTTLPHHKKTNKQSKKHTHTQKESRKKTIAKKKTDNICMYILVTNKNTSPTFLIAIFPLKTYLYLFLYYS